MSATPTAGYPATFKVDYPDRPLNRLTSVFRIIWIIPIAIILGMVANGSIRWGEENTGGWMFLFVSGSFLFFPLVLMILFRQKYPRWWFDWNLNLNRFYYRVMAYFALLRDEYPSTDEEQAVHLELRYPDAKNDIGQGWPLIKWLLAFPHWVIIVVLGFFACICVIIAWFAILFTGKYPKSLFDFVVGVMRWGLRVGAYALLLVTDKYPPFSLEE